MALTTQPSSELKAVFASTTMTEATKFEQSENCDEGAGMFLLTHYKPLELTFYSFALNNAIPLTAKSNKAAISM